MATATDPSELLEGQDVEALEEEQTVAIEAEATETEAPPESSGEAPLDSTLSVESQPEDSAPEESEEPGLTQRLLDLGFKDVTDDDAPSRLLETYEQQQQQLQQLQSEIAQLRPVYTQHLAQLQQQQAAPAAPAPEEPKQWWSPPKFEHGWMERYREPDAAQPGQFKWKENTPADVIANTQSYQNYIQDWADNLTSRPHEVLPPIIQEVVEPLFEKWYEDRRGKETSESFLEGIRSNHGDWLYEKDPRTHEITDRLSAEGQRAMDWASEAQELGIMDPQNQWAYVERMRDAYGAQSKLSELTKQQTTKEKAAEQRQKVRQRSVTNLPNRGGSKSEPGEPQNIHMSAGQQLLEALVEEGAQF
jgi:hypothetical protein